MEIAPERQRHVFGPVPGRYERRPFVAQQAQHGGQRGGVAGALDCERGTARRSDGGGFVGIDGNDAELCCCVAPPPLGLDRHHVAACLLDQAAHQDAEDAESTHDDGLTEHRAGVESDLERSLDVGKEDSEPWFQPRDRDHRVRR